MIKPIVYYDENGNEKKSKYNKRYLVLLNGYYSENENLEYKTYEFIIGRQKTYDFIKDILKDTSYTIIDAMKSLVIVDSENVHLSNALSVYEFMKNLKNSDKIKDDDLKFDIEEYYYNEEDDNCGKEE